MNKVYLYDGKFVSLIRLIFKLIDGHIIPINIISEYEYQENLLDEPVYLKLDNNDIKMDKDILNTCYYAYLSDTKDKEIIIYDFIKNYIKIGKQVIYHSNIDSVNKLINMSHRVSSETHKLKGFLRFKKMQNFYYAVIEPTNNVLFILTRHFVDRLGGECFIICDSKREIYALYDRKKVTYLKKSDILKLNLDFANDEVFFEDLWKTFFNTVAIKERKNPKCQMNHMPKKYWKNMLEME